MYAKIHRLSKRNIQIFLELNFPDLHLYCIFQIASFSWIDIF